MFWGLSSYQQANLLAKQIAALIPLLEFRSSGGRILVSVDFSEIHAYAFPSNVYIFQDAARYSTWLTEQIALTYLFEEYLKNGRNIYLLPPYKAELNTAISRETYKYIKYFINIETDILFKQMNHLFQEIKRDPTSAADDNCKLVNFLRNHYLELYVTLSLGHREPLSVLNRMNKLTKAVSLIDNSFSSQAFVRKVFQNSKSFLRNISDARPDHPASNQIDALALQYLQEINNRITSRGEVLVLVTRSGYGSLESKWPKLDWVKVRRGNGLSTFSVPQIIHPSAIFIYLISRVDENYGETVSILRGMLGITKDISSSYENLATKLDELRGEVSKRVKDLQGAFLSVDNLKAALRVKDERTRETIDGLIKVVLERREEPQKVFARRFKDLVAGIEARNTVTELIQASIEEIRHEIRKLLSDIIDLSTLSATWRLLPTGPASYLINENDFSTAEVRKIYRNLVDGKKEDFSSDLAELFALKDDLGRVFDERTSLQYWEARLLIVLLKERTANYVWAWNECDQCVKEAPKNIKPLFKFLRNDILSKRSKELDKELGISYGERLVQALEGSRRLIDEEDERTPRYLLQRGYLLCLGFERRFPKFSLEEAGEITKQALKRARQNLSRDITCYRLALCNLTNLALEQNDLNQAEAYFTDLEETLIDTKEQAPIFFYTRARLWFLRLKECQLEKGSSEFKEEVKKVWEQRNSMHMAMSRFGPRSKSAIPKHKRLSDDILKYTKENIPGLIESMEGSKIFSDS